MGSQEIDQRIEAAYGDGYLEGVLITKDANAWALLKAKIITSLVCVVSLIAISVLAVIAFT